MMTPELIAVSVEDGKPGGTKRIMKNVLIISLAFMVHFTAYSGAANLQSSVNAEAGLGTASLAAVYAGLIFSNIVSLPVIIIKYIGTKWTIALSFLAYMPYIAAQLWPTFYTLIPTGLLVGLGGGPLWCAKCTYISIVSEAHSKVSKIPAEALLVRFLGLFFMIFQINQVWGNLISSLGPHDDQRGGGGSGADNGSDAFKVLSSGDNSAAVTAINSSMVPQLCGGNFLPQEDAAVLQPQPPDKIMLIICIYLACMLGAALIVGVGVDSMKRYNADRPVGEGLSGLALLSLMVKLMVEPSSLLMITINIFIGFQQAFFMADFTAAFVSCAVGTGYVGFIMMTYGVADAIGCSVTGYLAKLTGRASMITVATIIQSILFITVLVWQPQASAIHVLYIIAILWGVCDSVWMVQINAYYGVLFPGREEAAFSNFRLWESVGFIIAYLISPYFRTSVKTYLIFIMMLVGVFFYFVVEFKGKKSKRTIELEKKEDFYENGGCDNIGFKYI